MRVLLVIDRFGSGGAQTQMAMLCGGLVNAGCQVSLFTYHENEFLQAERYLGGATLLSTRKSSGVGVVARLARLMRSGGYSGVISFLTGPNAYTAAARVVSAYGGRVIVAERNIFDGGRPTARERLQRFGHSFADAVVSNSASQTRVMADAFPWLRRKLHTIANAVDVEHFRPAATAPMANGSLLAVGRVVPEKNPLGLARALKTIRESGRTDVRVRWVGKVHDQAYFKACNAFLESAGLAGAWSWEGETSDVRKYYHQAQWLVLPSFKEGMPNVVGEALACGVPCLISRVADADWLMSNGRNGVVFDPTQPGEVVSALMRALSAPSELYSEYSVNARDFAERELSSSRMVSSYISLLQARSLQRT